MFLHLLRAIAVTLLTMGAASPICADEGAVSHSDTDADKSKNVLLAPNTPSPETFGPGRAEPYYGPGYAPSDASSLDDDEGSLLVGKLLKLLRGGGIQNGDVNAYPRIPALDVDDPDSVFYTYRPNLIGVDVPEAWDFYNMIASDRPDYTDSNMTVGKNVVLFESGYTYGRSFDPHTRTSTRQLPECLVRSGITDEIELRFRWAGYQLADQQDVASGDRLREYGSQDISFGLKCEWWQQKEWMPMAASVFHVSAPTGTAPFSANAVQPEASFLLGWGLRRWAYLKVGQGISWPREASYAHSDLPGGGFFVQRDSSFQAFEAVSLAFQVSKHVGAYSEWFVLYRSGSGDNLPANYYNTGVQVYVTPNVQLDARYGIRLSSRVQEDFAGCGFSCRW